MSASHLMNRMPLQVATAVSGALLVGTLVLFFVPWDRDDDPRNHCLSFGERFHVGVTDGQLGHRWPRPGRIYFFNDREYGPYRGSILSLVDEHGRSSNPMDREIVWGGSFGIIFRYFHWPSGTTLWTLSISSWYCLFLFASLPACWLWRYERARRRRDARAGQR